MLKIYFKIALRNIKRYRAHSILNIVGMAIGMACAILILLWVSYSSMIVFFGAEFTAAYANMFSGKVAPTEIAKAETPEKANKKL